MTSWLADQDELSDERRVTALLVSSLLPPPPPPPPICWSANGGRRVSAPRIDKLYFVVPFVDSPLGCVGRICRVVSRRIVSCRIFSKIPLDWFWFAADAQYACVTTDVVRGAEAALRHVTVGNAAGSHLITPLAYTLGLSNINRSEKWIYWNIYRKFNKCKYNNGNALHLPR